MKLYCCQGVKQIQLIAHKLNFFLHKLFIGFSNLVLNMQCNMLNKMFSQKCIGFIDIYSLHFL